VLRYGVRAFSEAGPVDEESGLGRYLITWRGRVRGRLAGDFGQTSGSFYIDPYFSLNFSSRLFSKPVDVTSLHRPAKRASADSLDGSGRLI
jgi:hypothetical protein